MSAISAARPVIVRLANIINNRDSDGRFYTVTEIETAKNFIRATLAEDAVPRKEIEAAAHEAGIASRTLRRAREVMHVITYKEEGKMTGRWMWKLPGREGFDGLSTKGRSRVWLVPERMASKRANRPKPVRVPLDPGGWTAS